MTTQGGLGLDGGSTDMEKGGKRGRKNGAGVTGRKDNAGQEGVIDKTALVKGMPKAIKIEKELADLKEDASALYKKLAEETNLNAATLRSAAKAFANDKEEAAKRKAEQSTLIFEECDGSGK